MTDTKEKRIQTLSHSLLPTSNVMKVLKTDLLALDSTGEMYLAALLNQMKDLKIYLSGDVELMLNDCALNYQFYRKHLELSIEEDDESKNHMKAMRFLKVVNDYTKQLGIGPLQRHKLKAFKEMKEETIFDQIEKLLDE